MFYGNMHEFLLCNMSHCKHDMMSALITHGDCFHTCINSAFSPMYYKS